MSSKSKHNTGLAVNPPPGAGTGAFFNKRPADGQPVDVKKMRTTIMLSPTAVAGIEALRTHARKQGSRLTTSKIIEDALMILLRERKIDV